MKFLPTVSLLVAWSWIAAFASGQEQWPLHNDGINSFVEWYVLQIHIVMGMKPIEIFSRDHYSYIFNGQRLFVWSGEVCLPLYSFDMT